MWTSKLGSCVLGIAAVAMICASVVVASPRSECRMGCTAFNGGETCRAAAQRTTRLGKDLCRRVFDRHTKECLPDADCMGYATLSACIDAAKAAGKGTLALCKEQRAICLDCCRAGGSTSTCGNPGSPSPAFID